VRSHSVIDPLPWQSVKAVARRHAQDLFNDYPHRPVSALHAALHQEIDRFLARWRYPAWPSVIAP
jgi:hypothetical protein